MSSKDDVTKDDAKKAAASDKPAKQPAADVKSDVKPDVKASEKTIDDAKDAPKEVKADSAEAAPVVKVAAAKTDDTTDVQSAEASPAAKKRFLEPLRPKDMRSLLVKVAAVAVALIAVVVGVFGVLVYVYKSENPVVAAVASVVPYPVERVNGRFVTYNSYLFELDANKRAYQNNAKLNNQPAVDFNSADGKKLVAQIKEHALEKLASDSLTAQLASSKKVKVTDKEVNDLINQLYERYGGKDTLLKTLKQIYGWDIADLRGVVYKQLLAKNLEEKVTSDPALDAAAKAKAADVQKKIKEGGDFTEIAKKYSQSSDAASGGDLGFFTKGQLPDELQKAAEALQPGQVSDPIKDQYGYEILKVVEKKDDGSIRAQHILIKTLDFNEYFQAELKKAKINKFLKA